MGINMSIEKLKENGFKLIEEYRFNSKYKSYVFAFKFWLIIIDDLFDKEESEEFFLIIQNIVKCKINICR